MDDNGWVHEPIRNEFGQDTIVFQFSTFLSCFFHKTPLGRHQNSSFHALFVQETTKEATENYLDQLQGPAVLGSTDFP